MTTLSAPVEAAGCVRCPLASTRTNVVWGFGAAHVPIMLVGEAPGYHEDRNGKPFIGQSGKHLDTLLAKAGLSRSQIYITNRVKCRPPANRDPLPREREACFPWLEYEIERVKPQVVILLGRHATTLAFPGELMRDIRGSIRSMAVGGHTAIFMPTYHPAAALRQGTLVSELIVEDLIKAKEMCA